tara:strand:+ start:248 stop:700 length:453 start_codon:yes stop_codon:yes gene_type:complete
MALSNATRLADFGTGIGTQGAVVQINNSAGTVGIGTTDPQGLLQVGTAITMMGTGNVFARKFYGDGSELENVSGGGIGTVYDNNSVTATKLIYTTARRDMIAAGTSVTIEGGVGGGFMTYSTLNTIDVGAGATFHVGSGTTLIMNVLNVF